MMGFLSFFKEQERAFIDKIFSNVESPTMRHIGRVLAKLFNLKKDLKIKVRGITMYANTWDRIVALLLWKYSLSGAFEMAILKDKIKSGMVVLDIGANIGYYSLEVAKLVGSKGHVYAFEPEQENFRLLQKNILANNLKNVTAYQKAVAEKSGILNLYFCEEHRGDHRVYASQSPRRVVKIDAIAVDDFFKGKKVDIIKMDIQGFEYFALFGMRNLLKKNNPIVLTEFAPHLLSQAGSSAEKYLTLLEDCGFSINLIHEKNRCIIPIEKEKLISLCKDGRYANLFLEKSNIKKPIKF